MQTFNLSLFICFITLSQCVITAQSFVEIKPDKKEYRLVKHLSVLEDAQSKYTIQDVSSDSLSRKFVSYEKESLNFGFSNSVFWLKFQIADPTSKNNEWLILNNYPVLKDIALYYENSTGGFAQKKSGLTVPVGNRKVKSIRFVSSIPVRKDTVNNYYLRVTSGSPVILSFDLTDYNNYTNSIITQKLFHGAFFGALGLMILYNLLLFIGTREKIYIYYVLYVFSYMFYQLCYEGYFSLYISSNMFGVNPYIYLMIAASCFGFFWLLLTREFLSTRIYLPNADKWLQILTVTAGLIVLMTLFFPPKIMVPIFSVGDLSFFTFGMILAIVALKRGNELALFYIVALSGTSIAIFIIAGLITDVLPLNFWTDNAIHFGILWEATLLSFILSHKIKTLRDEKEKEKTNIRNRIAVDLHDEIGSNLSTISLQTQLLKKKTDPQKSYKTHIDNILSTANETSEMIKDIVWFINPVNNNSEDLVLRLKELASKMLYNINYTFNISFDAFDHLPDMEKRRHVYLIIKEALTNIVKHSGANDVTIDISAGTENFTLNIFDNGEGFNKCEVKSGNGLRNINNRARQLNADIKIESEIEKGTKIGLEISLRKYKKT